MNRFAGLTFALSLLMSATGAPAAEPVTTGTLVNEMIDMWALTRYPEPAYKTVQFSSYDRRSDLPGGPGWFDNSDGFGKEPIPNFQEVLTPPDDDGVGEYLICDVQGPGAIVRVWTARISGQIRVYLDGADQPLYDGPAEPFLMHPYRGFAETAGVETNVFESTFQQRNACYLPIPFAERCKIVWIGKVNEIHFYEVQVRQYQAGTPVKTFAPLDLKTYEKEIKQVSRVLSSPIENWSYRAGQSQSLDIEVGPGQVKELLAVEGAKAIEKLTLKVTADHPEKALRQNVLRIACDGSTWDQVQSPIGDFFGAAPGVNVYDSVPFTVEPDGSMTSRYVMPFKQSCRILIDNKGDQPIKLHGTVLVTDYDWDEQRSMYFRARWRVDHDVTAGGTAGVHDMPYLLANGKGVYVGTSLMLLNPNDIPWPGGNWWGEGDEKIFVDDDFQPSTFGTGSEDYFNYAWSSPNIFIYPYCGQPVNDGPANRGFVTNYRWHILDALPFRDRISFYMELFPHERTDGFSYARIGYHYGRPGIIDDQRVLTREDVRHLELPGNWQVAARGGATGYTFYQAEDLAADKAGITIDKAKRYANGQMMFWRARQKGDELTLKLPVEKAGKQMMFITAALTPESGRFSLWLDGQQIKDIAISRQFTPSENPDVVDLHDPHRRLLRNVRVPQQELDKGKHDLTLRYEGGAGKTIGLDFIWIKQVD